MHDTYHDYLSSLSGLEKYNSSHKRSPSLPPSLTHTHTHTHHIQNIATMYDQYTNMQICTYSYLSQYNNIKNDFKFDQVKMSYKYLNMI